MLMPHGLTAEEIRVLQEFRRIGQKTMTFEEIRAIKHPVGGGDTPAKRLVEKGFLTADPSGLSVTLTPRAEEFLAYDPLPLRKN